MRLLLALGLTGALLFPLGWGTLAWGKKKNKEEVTQSLETPRDPPSAIVAQTRRLVFHNSSLQAHGLLSVQTREAVREILKESNGMQVVKLRAFVAGTGDLRRVPQIVSESFGEKKHLTLPAVSVIQVGGLPLEGAQIVLEAVSESKRDVNPQGLLYVSARPRSLAKPFQPLEPLASQSLDDLQTKLAGRGQALRITCFASASEDSGVIHTEMTRRFPSAALDLIQTQRTSSTSSVTCEAVARAEAPLPVSIPDLAVLDSERVVLTGAQIAFGLSENDGRLAFRRMEKVLAPFGASLKTAVSLHLYPLSPSIAAQAARLRLEFINPEHPPVTTFTHFESLPGMDASFAIEAVAPVTAAALPPA